MKITDRIPGNRMPYEEGDSVIRFIQETSDEDWDEGMDIMISDIDYQNVIMGNHDGVLVTRKAEQVGRQE